MLKTDAPPRLYPTNPHYLYILSTLRESIIDGGVLKVAFSLSYYRPACHSFVGGLSRKTIGSRVSGTRLVTLNHRISVLPGKADNPAEARIIVQCPGGWSPVRFEEVAAKEWAKNPWGAELLVCKAIQSANMQLDFLSEGGGARLEGFGRGK